jgi:hypothetical protein
MSRHPIIDARADRARKALAGGDYEGIDDLITDLWHLCEVERFDMFEMIRKGQDQFKSEDGEGDDIEQDVRRHFDETGRL